MGACARGGTAAGGPDRDGIGNSLSAERERKERENGGAGERRERGRRGERGRRAPGRQGRCAVIRT
ncbi:hypothetical protein CRV15_33510 (plasmid) [Streptomyces clavuligerus]|nr:hypothetical protein D1794_32795 [Streptomyces clavuligerus]QCS10461.1 hypothetical protein CRV15_33510 [Streptomyces clavuligerus]